MKSCAKRYLRTSRVTLPRSRIAACRAGPAQIEVAVAQAQILRGVGLLLHFEGRRARDVEHAHVVRIHLDLAGGHVAVDHGVGAAHHRAAHREHELGAGGARLAQRLLGHLAGMEDDLSQAAVIAQVDEDHAAVIARALHPSHEHGGGAGVGAAKRAAEVRAPPVAHRLRAHPDLFARRRPVLRHRPAFTRVHSRLLECRRHECAAPSRPGAVLIATRGAGSARARSRFRGPDRRSRSAGPTPCP